MNVLYINVKNIIVFIFIIAPYLFFSPAGINIALTILSISVIIYFFSLKNIYSRYPYEILSIIIFFLYLIFLGIFFYKQNESYLKNFFYIKFLFLILSAYELQFFINQKQLKIYKISYFTITLIIIIDLFIQYFTGKNIINLSCEMSCTRNSSFFGKELIAGSYLSIVGLIALSTNYLDYVKKKTLMFSIFFLALIVAILFSGDRTPLFMVMCVLLVNIFFNIEIRKNFMMLLILFATIFLISISFSKNTFQRFNHDIKQLLNAGELTEIELNIHLSLLNQKKKETNNIEEIKDINDNILSTQKRIKLKKKIDSTRQGTKKTIYRLYDTVYGALYLNAFEIIYENPFFGVGIRNFRHECEKYLYKINSAFALNSCQAHPHNLHLEILTETGVIGYLLFLNIMISFFYKYLFVYKNNKVLLIFLFSIAFSIIFPFKPSGAIFSTWYGMVFWLLICNLILFCNKKHINKL